MANPTSTRKPSAKREAILDAAQAAFLEEGYSATSMDAVASRAGVSKATIYAHFESKDQLFAAVIRRRCDRSPVFQPPSVAWQAGLILTEVAHRLMELLLAPETLAMYRVVVAESSRQPDLARAFYESGPGAGKAQIAEVMAELHRRGEMNLPDPWLAADIFVGMLRTDLFMRVLLGLPARPGQDLDQVIAMAVDTMIRAYGRA